MSRLAEKYPEGLAIHNNGLGPVVLPPPRGLPPGQRAALRPKLRVPARSSTEVLPAPIAEAVLAHKTVRPLVESGILTLIPAPAHRRLPSTSVSPAEVERSLADPGRPSDLLQGLRPDDARLAGEPARSAGSGDGPQKKGLPPPPPPTPAAQAKPADDKSDEGEVAAPKGGGKSKGGGRGK